jgi:hypothetical protein
MKPEIAPAGAGQGVPAHASGDAALDPIHALRDDAGLPTHAFDPATSGPLRSRDLAGGVGAR